MSLRSAWLPFATHVTHEIGPSQAHCGGGLLNRVGSRGLSQFRSRLQSTLGPSTGMSAMRDFWTNVIGVDKSRRLDLEGPAPHGPAPATAPPASKTIKISLIDPTLSIDIEKMQFKAWRVSADKSSKDQDVASAVAWPGSLPSEIRISARATASCLSLVVNPCAAIGYKSASDSVLTQGGGVSALHRNLHSNYVAKQISQDRPNLLAGAAERAGIELLGPQTPDRAGSGCEILRGPERPWRWIGKWFVASVTNN
jgi:hypothetical protein